MVDCDPVGVIQIADRLLVSRSTVEQWRKRGLDFPLPRWRVGGSPAWNWHEVLDWALAHNRTPEQRLAADPELHGRIRAAASDASDARPRPARRSFREAIPGSE